MLHLAEAVRAVSSLSCWPRASLRSTIPMTVLTSSKALECESSLLK